MRILRTEMSSHFENDVTEIAHCYSMVKMFGKFDQNFIVIIVFCDSYKYFFFADFSHKELSIDGTYSDFAFQLPINDNTDDGETDNTKDSQITETNKITWSKHPNVHVPVPPFSDTLSEDSEELSPLQ